MGKSTPEMKAGAKRLREFLKDKLNISITQSLALEAVAVYEGFPNWDTAAASGGRRDRPQIALPDAAFIIMRDMAIASSEEEVYHALILTCLELCEKLKGQTVPEAQVLLFLDGHVPNSTSEMRLSTIDALIADGLIKGLLRRGDQMVEQTLMSFPAQLQADRFLQFPAEAQASLAALRGATSAR